VQFCVSSIIKNHDYHCFDTHDLVQLSSNMSSAMASV